LPSQLFGKKIYNGVAIAGRLAQQRRLTGILTLEEPQRRILIAMVADYRIVNLYVLNGSEVDSDKYEYKLDWLSKVTQFLQTMLSDSPRLIVLGDFNIAPKDIDVHDPEKWQGSVLVSEAEREAYSELLACGLTDSFRLVDQSSQFSWWDYRRFAFKRNAGLRIDLILVSDVLVNDCVACEIDREARKHERPSDHAPVVLSLR
jgi:exodeoxyribonuclease III